MRIFDGRNEPIDYCATCAPTEEEAGELHGAGEGPDGRGNCFSYDTAQPPYGEPGWQDYACAACGEPLTEHDD